ncbi:hypothetical protein BIY21_10805 [Vibrio ponticus]|uniref:Peptidase C45 hydrolase domain-containing protein n=1 Tax=Vibrio ponticus TaxID=265668 RepID=A0ABX3FI02_9VIBR|nr:C45 family peptidase [Vibrio ponticus]OLQ93800.1 hypothetical protein BIY21_10805 [Vibrio ponticus]
MDNYLNSASLREQQGIKIVRLAGTHYEMGYQHGYLLAEPISVMLNQTMPAAVAVIAKTLHSSWEDAWQKYLSGAAVAEKFVPDCLLSEMQGIADGATAAGYPTTLEQIRTWNTMYDQWCIYAHPHFWNVDDPETKGQFHEHGPGTRILAGAGCSSFSAWGKQVGGNGSMIFCKNEDNLNLPGQLEHRYMFVCAPKEGIAHLYLAFPGMVGFDGGFNAKGISVMTQYDASIHETMAGYGLGVLTRLALLNGHDLSSALEEFRSNPRRTGIAYHCADAKNKQAAVIECSAKVTTERYPLMNTESLWQANHSICYPGYMGYSGYNYVQDQQLVYELDDVSSVGDYLTSLKAPYNFVVPAPSRFERYDQLLHQHYGKIDLEIAKEIMCDRYDPYTRQERAANSPSYTNNILATISAYYPEEKFSAPYGDFYAGVANLWCLVTKPDSGDFLLAIDDFPANQGEFKSFNFFELLEA